MKQLLRLLLGIIPCLFFACEYSPSGSHYEEVNPRPNVQGDISLQGHEDTVYVRGDITFLFNMELPGRTIFGWRVLFDDKTVSTSGQSVPHFGLESGKYKDGFHTMQFQVYGSSGTGSLADKKGEEGLIVYQTWVVHIDNSPVVPIAITSIKPHEGQLKVEWQPVKRYGFEAYELHRYYGKRAELVGTFTDPNTSSWIDPDYVGGPVSYAVMMLAGPYNTTWYTKSTDYDYPMPVLESSYDHTDALTFSFNASPFYRNFKGYELTSDEGHTYTTNNINDTIVTWSSFEFGKPQVKINIRTLSKEMDVTAYEAAMTESVVPGLGTPWGPVGYTEVLKRPLLNRMYAIYSMSIKLVNTHTLTIAKERPIWRINADGYEFPYYAVSENGQYFYFIQEQALHKLNPLTLETEQIISFEDLFADPSFTGRHWLLGIGISNNNRLMLAVHDAPQGVEGVYVVDMNTRKVLTYQESEAKISSPAISPDGKLLTFDNKLYIEKSKGSWQQHALSIPDESSVILHPSQPLFSVKRGRNISFYATATGALEKTITTEAELKSYEVDAGSGYLYGFTQDMMYIYNIDTGHQFRKLKVYNRWNPVSPQTMFVFNDKILTNNRYIKL